MKLKNKSPNAVVLSPQDCLRVAQLVALFMAVDKQMKKKGTKKGSPIKRSFRLCSRQAPLSLLLIALSLCSHFSYWHSKVHSMIDTIILTLGTNAYTITNPHAFSPSATWILNAQPRSYSRISSIQNPTTRELRSGIYKPKLTLAQRMNTSGKPEVMLKIELSLPKLMFGNNFAELQFKDFAPVANKLATVLADMGVATTAQALAQADVIVIHYSKNIKLTDGSIPYHYINKCKEANAQLSLDVNQTDYRNGGHGYRWHCNAYEVVFYDKIKDLEKAKLSRRRAIEKDSDVQLNLFSKLQKRHMLEFLRMEVRLNRRHKMRHLFGKLGVRADLTFKKLFKPAIAKKVLLHYIDELQSKRPALLDYKPISDKALLAALIINNPDMKTKQILQLYGLKKALDVASLRELRTMFAKTSTRSWYRLMQDANNVKLPATSSPFKEIKEQLVKFEAVRL